MASKEDKEILVEDNEPEEVKPPKRTSSFKRKWQRFGFKSNRKNEKVDEPEAPEQGAVEDSIKDSTVATNQTVEAVYADVNDDSETRRAAWKDRANPFDAKTAPGGAAISFDVHQSYEDDVFSKGIVDLDDEISTDGILRKKQLFSEGESFDNAPFGRYNSEDGKELSVEEVEEINLKTQFKGAYYNIGSTEDLLQELSQEQSAVKKKLDARSQSETTHDRPIDDIIATVEKTPGYTRASFEEPQPKGSKDQDNIPLIDRGEEEDTTVYSQDQEEHQEENEMPLFGKKKPAPVVEKEPEKVPEPVADGAPEKKADDVNSPDQKVAEPVANGEATDQGQVNVAKEDNTVTFTKDTKGEDADGKGAPSPDATVGKKSEKSPLIDKDSKENGGEVDGSKGKDKESKVKDTGPGLLCCTIL